MFASRAVYDAFVVLQEAKEEAGQISCEQYPDAWFPGDGTNAAYETRWAKQMCNECPIRQQCLEYALVANEEHGIWGGLTRQERTALKRNHLTLRRSA